jgi:hypothetical protein
MTAAKQPSLERFREDWQRQLVADRKLFDSDLRVALAIGWHLNRDKKGWAWPGMRTLAKLTGLSKKTVVLATGRLEARGYLRIVRGRKGNRRLANQYLPTLTNAGLHHALGGDHVVYSRGDHGGLPQGLPEPLTEPLKQPPIPINIGNVSRDVVVNEGSRQEIEERGIPLSWASECYRLARENYGERGAALVAKALWTTEARDVLDSIRDAIESGDDIGRALWQGD